MIPSPPFMTVKDTLIGLSVGGYRIERLVGQGGMGLVYLAQHELIDRRFAVKVLRPEWAGDVSQQKSFLREAQTLSALKHPNIIEIVGFGPLPDGRMHMVMEFLEGHTLEHELALGQLPLDRLLQLCEQILNALVAAHSVEVIHRDLKPSNVFLARGSGGIEVIKLLDFGLAREQPAAFGPLELVPPACSVVAGTPEYSAPEQTRGGAPDKSSDLYSFGVMLFEMLTGRLPFEPGITVSNRAAKLVSAHTTEIAPTPAFVGVQVPHQLSVLLRELLQKDAARRPSGAQEVRERISAVRQLLKAASQPIPLVTRARPVKPLEAVVRGRGQPWGLLGATLALGLLVVVLLGSGFGSAAPVDAAPVAAPLAPPAPPPVVVARVDPPKPLVPVAGPPPRARAVKPPRPSAARIDCEPDERWRAAARTHLQELQQLAAADQNNWLTFERLEPALSGAISAATTGGQCEATEQQIRRLAKSWRK